MQKLILTTESELDNLIQSSVRKAISESQKQQSTIQSERYLTIKEAALYLNLAVQTLYGFTSNRTIPHIKKGKKLYFSSESLDNWLKEGKKKSSKELLDEFNGK